jgi:uncharacterized protein (TIGR02452 family)
MTTQELIDVYEDTKRQVQDGIIQTYATTEKFDWSQVPNDPFDKGYDTLISVLNLDSVSAAQQFAKADKTAILNMASPLHPGGGVHNGARAQEECLFRCSDLFQTIEKDFYPLYNSEGLYTRSATFFKGFDYSPIVPFEADVITVAALNLNMIGLMLGALDYLEVTRLKVRLILALAQRHKVENLVLGAWGCGVFRNEPQTIATLFKEELTDYQGYFQNVCFAVINDHNSVANNYDIFKRVLDPA